MGIWMDAAIIITTLVTGILGWRLGNMRAVFPIVGAGVGVFVASHQYHQVAGLLPEGVASSEVARPISLAVVALAVFVASLLVGSIARRVLRFCLLGWADGLAGLVASVSLTLVVWGLALGVVSPVLGGEFTDSVRDSRLAGPLVHNVFQLASLVPEPVKSYVEDNFVKASRRWPPSVTAYGG